jgi:hypothetical protein
MVKPESIRRGSKVFFADTKDEPVTVLDNINGKISVQLSKLIITYAEDLFPVPLTPEIILRCPFIKTDDFLFEHKEDHIELEYDHDGVTHMHIHQSNTSLQFTALHELQHAYWMLTNKELGFQ